jgi:hypothetical protein
MYLESQKDPSQLNFEATIGETHANSPFYMKGSISEV